MENTIITKIKSLWSNRVIRYAFLVCLILLLLGYCFYTTFKLRQAKSDLSRQEKNIELLTQQITYEKNRAGELTAKVESFRLRADEVENFSKDMKEQLQKFSKKLKDIESYTKVVTSTKDSIIIKHDLAQAGGIKHDTVKIVSTSGQEIKELPFNYSDSFLVVSGKVNSTDIKLNYEYKSALEIAYVWKNKRSLFKDPVLETMVTSKNPKEKIINLQALKIEPPKKKWWQTKGFAFGSGFTIGAGLITTAIILSK